MNEAKEETTSKKEKLNDGREMDLKNGKYLGKEIFAFSGDEKSMWIVVWDGKYNYYLFSALNHSIMVCKQRGQMPHNNASGLKMTEYYTVYDTALKNLCKVVANGGFC